MILPNRLQKVSFVFSAFRYFQGHRAVNRPGQRVIRLNTTIIVKRVEGAFVPSRLKKKDADGGADRKQLSTELNVILNRLSDANLSETVEDIRKINFSSPEDLQLLSGLVFQKVCYGKS